MRKSTTAGAEIKWKFSLSCDCNRKFWITNQQITKTNLKWAMERIHRPVNFFITSCIFSIRYRYFQDSQKLNLQYMNLWPRRSQAMLRRSSCLVAHSDRFDPRNSNELLYGYLCYTTHEIYVSCVHFEWTWNLAKEVRNLMSCDVVPCFHRCATCSFIQYVNAWFCLIKRLVKSQSIEMSWAVLWLEPCHVLEWGRHGVWEPSVWDRSLWEHHNVWLSGFFGYWEQR